MRGIVFRLRLLIAGWCSTLTGFFSPYPPIAGGAPEGGEGGGDGGEGKAGADDKGGDASEPKGDKGGERKPDPKKDEKPPWGSDEEFDAEKAWRLIQNVRSDADKAKKERDEFRAKVDKHEDENKSESQRLEDRATKAERRADEAEQESARLRVALKKGLNLSQAKRLVGASEDELEQDADELLETFRSENGEQGDPPPRRPTEKLRPGAAPSSDGDGEDDPKKLAEQVPRSW